MKRSDYIEIRNKLSFQKRNSALAMQFLLDGAIALAIFELWSSGSLRYLAFPLLSVLIFRSFSIMHDAVHGSVSKAKFVNTAVGIFYGSISFLPFDQWRAGHLKHHIWSGNVDQDPVMAILKKYPSMSDKAKSILDFGWKYWIPTLSFAQHLVFWALSLKEMKESKLTLPKALSIVGPLIFWSALILSSSLSFTLAVIIPAVYLYLVGVEVINLPHHLQLVTMKEEEQLRVWDQYRTAPSCAYPQWIARFIVLNFNLHAEHHMYPDAPWYCLSEIHKEIEPLLGKELVTDNYFDWILVNRKRSLVDALYQVADYQEQTGVRKA